jgi:hypothetical protein
MTDLTGRALDAAVAERIMGGCVFPVGTSLECVEQKIKSGGVGVWGEHAFAGGDWFEPSTDIAAAMNVVEAMRGKGYWWRIVNTGESFIQVLFDYPHSRAGRIETVGDCVAETKADLPAAICRAALAATGATESEAGK